MTQSVKSPRPLFDSKCMSNNTNTKNFDKNTNTNKTGNTGKTGSTTGTSANNELIAAIDKARGTGTPVKQIRKQKHDPSNFYFTLEDGKQVGPVNVAGDQNELNRKFGEAQSYLHGTKSQNRTPSAA